MPSVPWRVETWKNLRKIEKLYFFIQNDQNLSQKCSNTFSTCSEVVFLVKKIDQFTLEGQFEKKPIWNFCPKSLLRVSKHVLRWIEIFCSVQGSKLGKNRKKIEKFEFLKVSKNVLKSFQTSFELVLRYFSEKNIAQCTLEGRNMEKHHKNGKTFVFFQNAQKCSPKSSNKFWLCFEVVFSVKKFDQCTLDGRNLEKFEKKIEKKFEISKVSKNVPESVQTSFEIVLRWFFRKNMPSAPCRVKTWKNTKKLEKLSIFQNAQKTFPKAIKHVLNLFRGNCFGKMCAQCILEGRVRERFGKNGKF